MPAAASKPSDGWVESGLVYLWQLSHVHLSHGTMKKINIFVVVLIQYFLPTRILNLFIISLVVVVVEMFYLSG